MKRCAALAVFLLFLTGLSGCARTQAAEATFFAMDTVMSARVWHGAGGAADAQAVQSLVTELEQTLSVTDERSELYRLNADGQAELSADTLNILQQTLALSARTGGALDPTLYPAVRLWGFTTGDYRVPSEAEIAEAMAAAGTEHVSIDGSTVTLTDGAMLDFGAVAKGYAAQKAADELAARGAAAAVLSLGGNVQTLGSKPDGTPWKIDVRDPFDGTRAAVTLSLTGSHAVVTSGGYQRYFEEDGVRYSHIFDPETGAPARSGLASVTVAADDGLLADGLSTALYVMGLDAAADFWRASDDFEAVLITDGGEIFVTEGLSGSVSGAEVQVIGR